MKRVAINGSGRIGRMILRAYAEFMQNNSPNITDRLSSDNTISSRYHPPGYDEDHNQNPNFQIVCINDLGSLEDIAYLLKYDSVHGQYKGNIEIGEDYLDIGYGRIEYIQEPDPAKIPWDKLGIDIVLECTGANVRKRNIRDHIHSGAKKVIVSTIYDDVDSTIVYGINEGIIDPSDQVISCASCTSNCIIPIIKVLDDSIGVEYGHMNSIHAYTNGQSLVDSVHTDRLRARAVSASMIPSSTNAATAVDMIFPELAGRIKCNAVRVPILNVSMIEFNFVSRREVSIEVINDSIIEASNTYLKGILGYNTEPMVSIDFTHDSRSAVVDISHTDVTKGKLCRVLAWYDNEWGYANRMCDLVNHVTL